MENASSLAQLARLVPSSKDSVSSWVKDRLCKSDEESDYDDMVAGFRCRKRESQHCPHQLAAWYPYRWADFRENDLTGNLANNVSDSPGGINQVDLVPVHGQILLHPTHEGITDVGLIQILDEVAQRQDGD